MYTLSLFFIRSLILIFLHLRFIYWASFIHHFICPPIPTINSTNPIDKRYYKSVHLLWSPYRSHKTVLRCLNEHVPYTRAIIVHVENCCYNRSYIWYFDNDSASHNKSNIICHKAPSLCVCVVYISLQAKRFFSLSFVCLSILLLFVWIGIGEVEMRLKKIYLVDE